MKTYNKDIQDRGEAKEENWEKLYKFMDDNDFSNADFLACVCANLKHQEGKRFITMLMVGGEKFQIEFLKV